MTISVTQAKGKAPRRAATKPKRFSAQKRENRIGWAFMAPFAVLLTFMFILPTIWAIYSSFLHQVTGGGGAYGGGELVDKFIGFQNFQYAIAFGNFRSSVGRVLIYTLIQVPIIVIVALASAIVIDSSVVKRVIGFHLSYFLPYAISGVVTLIIWVYLYNGQISPIVKRLAAIGVSMDLFNRNIVLGSMASITTWASTGYGMLVFPVALQAIPHDLYETARIDGANGWQITARIKLPGVRGTTLLAMLLSTVGTIQLFNEPQTMSAADPDISKSCTPMMMAMNASQGTITPSGDGPASAIVIVMALIAGVLAVLYTSAEGKANE